MIRDDIDPRQVLASYIEDLIPKSLVRNGAPLVRDAVWLIEGLGVQVVVLEDCVEVFDGQSRSPFSNNAVRLAKDDHDRVLEACEFRSEVCIREQDRLRAEEACSILEKALGGATNE